ncbi:MAG: hypothetical protein ACI8ZF_000895 [Candidatus Midichloriaceae bacterium]|jgi:hypothetical protein
MKNMIMCRYISLFIALFCFVSCTHNESQKIDFWENNDVAAVISGCTTHIKSPEKAKTCKTSWKNDTGDIFVINKPMDVKFVKPGTYEFVGYDYNYTPKRNLGGFIFSGDPTKKRYQKFSDSISLFTKFTVKAKDVVYIGNLNADFRENKNIITAFELSYEAETAKNYLQKKYPSLVERMQVKKVFFSPQAGAIKNLFNKDKDREKGKS